MHQLNQWHPNYSVFVKELDDQHKKLIDMLNELYDAYLNNIHKEKVGETIAQMLDYANAHFTTEETYFEKFGYEDAENHILAHNIFLEKTKEFQSNYQQNKSLLSLQIIRFLQDWLKEHMLTADKKYVSCFKNGGLK